MKKTSRRRFGKQLTGALVSLPVMTTVLEGHQQKTQEQKKTAQAEKEHNTPPPMFFMPGSLIIEAATNKNDWDSFQQPQQTDRKTWSVMPKPYPNGGPQPINIYIAHVKVLDGSGEMIYHLDNESTTEKGIPIKITASVYKANGNFFGDCILTPSGNHFELSVPNDKKIKQNNINTDPSTNPGLRQRARFMHAANDDENFIFKKLKIDKGTVNLFDEQDLPSFPGYSDLRVMVWWSNFT